MGLARKKTAIKVKRRRRGTRRKRKWSRRRSRGGEESHVGKFVCIQLRWEFLLAMLQNVIEAS